jgi:hypothetical protein
MARGAAWRWRRYDTSQIVAPQGGETETYEVGRLPEVRGTDSYGRPRGNLAQWGDLRAHQPFVDEN